MNIWVHKPRMDIIKYREKYFFDILKKGMDFYESYYDIKYPFPKYDLIFLPNFSFNAMENAGIVAILDRNFSPYMES